MRQSALILENLGELWEDPPLALPPKGLYPFPMANRSRSPRMNGDPRDRFDAIYPAPAGSFTVPFGTLGTLSAALLTTTCSVVRLYTTQDCFVRLDGVTALSSDCFLPAGIVEYFGVAGGTKISALQSSVAGTLYCTPGAD